MLLWLLNLEFAGGFAPSAPTEFIPIRFQAAVGILGQPDCPLRYESGITVDQARDTGV